FCGTCHGTEGQSRGLFPDLRYSAALGSSELFNSIVVDGALAANGMASFKTALVPDDVHSIRAYLVARAIDAQEHGATGRFSSPLRGAGRASAKPEASH